MEVGLIYRSKQMIEINRYSTPVQIMHELTCFKKVYIINLGRFKFLYNGETLNLKEL